MLELIKTTIMNVLITLILLSLVTAQDTIDDFNIEKQGTIAYIVYYAVILIVCIIVLAIALVVIIKCLRRRPYYGHLHKLTQTKYNSQFVTLQDDTIATCVSFGNKDIMTNMNLEKEKLLDLTSFYKS